MGGFFSNLRSGLRKTRDGLVTSLKKVVDRVEGDELRESLEELLLGGDVGIRAANRLIRSVEGKQGDRWELIGAEMIRILEGDGDAVEQRTGTPHVIVLVGTNGSGKTTTAGKLAHRYRAEGKSVLLAAADTYRAAAIEQLQVWSERTGADLVRQDRGGDAASVAYDALNAAIARSKDVLIVDTAGRLQTKSNLMEELGKIRRVLAKHGEEYPHETLLVLDAAVGQNALSQAKLFHQAVHLDGLVLTKLDGTAKGGMVLAVREEVDLPVRYIGVGESADDLMEFSAGDFVKALLG